VIACLCFFMVCRHIVPGQSIAALIAQTISCIILVGVVAHSKAPTINSILKSKAAQFLGRVSFSLYLLNVLVLICLWSIPGLSTPTVHAIEVGLLVGFVSLLITLPFAYASERWIERPGIALGRRIALWKELWPTQIPIQVPPAD
jgi:peptidoglycan/LPS O-acetylase OafA/YrhL